MPTVRQPMIFAIWPTASRRRLRPSTRRPYRLGRGKPISVNAKYR
jgi:hypothetical protein